MTNMAARVGDMHTCPMFDGPKPHVGGPILPPGSPQVLVGGQPAARATDQAACSGPPDFIVVGSSTVLIGNLMAAYQGSQTSHGGAVTIGQPTVLIGGPPAGATLGNPEAAAAIFPGHQSARNCGVQSVQQIIRQATGNNISEDDMLDRAIENGWARDNDNPALRGETTPSDRRNILADRGVASHLEPQSMPNIAQAVAEGRGVITSHDAGVLWGDTDYNGAGHAVQVTGVQYDSNGQIQNVIINDTGTGDSANPIPRERFEGSLRSSRDANVTDAPIFR
jgi:uncharacterized Zn-binding protein involved in type VI secretion